MNADPAPSIIAQPASQTVTAGQTAIFSVSGTPPLSYQWKKNGTAISGAKSSGYTNLAETTSDRESQFAVVASNSAGSAISNAAMLAVSAAAAVAQTNPLISDFLPSINTNCSDSQYANNIWMTDSTQKVRQDSGSPATNACYITIYGTQNEFIDFQVHFHDTGSGTSNLSVTVGNFVQTSPSSYTLSAATTPPPNVIVYREAYVHVQSYPSNNQLDSAVPGGTNYNTYYQGALGNHPDILIPAVDPYWGQTTNAWPFTVAANQNQSAWVDVLIPSSAPSGYYLGSVTVKSGSTTLTTTPVIIAVSSTYRHRDLYSVPAEVGTPVTSPELVKLPRWQRNHQLQRQDRARNCVFSIPRVDRRPSSSVTGYNVYRSTVSGNDYVKINSSRVSGLSYVDGTVLDETTYYYVLTSVDASGDESGYSTEVQMVIL
jgi:hypothetical protein